MNVKKIHYCWFGRNPLPEKAINCINSWKKYCPDYEIVEWNEDNFDINSCKYIQEAYQQKKYAFVSDYARYYILYKNGGVYLDVDVELLKPIDDLCNTPVLGFESKNLIGPGLIIIADSGMNYLQDMLDIYQSYEHFTMNQTIGDITTKYFLQKGLKLNNTKQVIDGITFYPMEYFNPKGENFGKVVLTSNTYSIHHYAASWKTKKEKKLMAYRAKFGRKFGTVLFAILHPIFAIRKVKSRC